MLVCSCNYITSREIEEVILGFLEEDCWQLIVPNKIYHAMEKRGRCCGCFPGVVDLILATTARFHAERQSSPDDVVVLLDKVREIHAENLRQQAAFRQSRVKRAIA